MFGVASECCIIIMNKHHFLILSKRISHTQLVSINAKTAHCLAERQVILQHLSLISKGLVTENRDIHISGGRIEVKALDW